MKKQKNMKKKNLLTKMAVVTLALTVGLAACHKDDDNGPIYTPKELVLTAGTWSFADATVSDSITQDSVVYTACAEDDSLAFSRGFTYDFSDGTTVCDSSLAPYGEGQWAFQSGEDTLLVQKGEDVLKWDVVTLNDTVLQVQYVDSLDGNAWTKKLSFIRAATDTTGN